jgi:hydrogenase maturation protein HypF
MSQNKKRFFITLSGSVQGVGFRPFVFRLAHRFNLSGHIKNTSSGVLIDVQGALENLAAFRERLLSEKPERASISTVDITEAPLNEAKTFEIAASESLSKTSLALLPDSALCAECLKELYDPSNRRYLYPFLHCMSCGPRFSLFCRMPFDRNATTMTDFTMCTECEREYQTPSDRRFYSQTNCCPACGPKLELFDNRQNPIADPLLSAKKALGEGKIIAVKNIGGFLLLVDASNDSAVNRLRRLKRRLKKPFALLVPNIAAAKEIADVDSAAETLLTSPAAPIVLILKRSSKIAPSVACNSPYFGIMLPHTPLLHLLTDRPLVATSGNISGRPICITNESAFSELSQIADDFLIHNRRIMHRLDDSVVQLIEGQMTILRRARGYIPFALNFPSASAMVAAGGHLKNSFAFADNDRLYLSQYIGNLESVQMCKTYEQELNSWKSLLKIAPAIEIGDCHPDYTTSHLFPKRLQVQHHHAHVFSCMVDNQLSPSLFAISWDGTGLGSDQTIWGGEAFIVTEQTLEHFATLLPFPLLGGEKAVREPRRIALALHPTWKTDAFTDQERNLLPKSSSLLCSSIGRLFDGVAALLDCCYINDFEGDAAILLEALALKAKNARSYSLIVTEKNFLDWRNMIQQIVQDKEKGIAVEEIALGFHLALADAIVLLAQKASLKNVILTGGVMQNKLLAEEAIFSLRKAGFMPFWHHDIPPNDQGLAAGQLKGASYVLSPSR